MVHRGAHGRARRVEDERAARARDVSRRGETKRDADGAARAKRIAKRARAALEVAVEVARVVTRHSWARRAALATASRACVWALSGA